MSKHSFTATVPCTLINWPRKMQLPSWWHPTANVLDLYLTSLCGTFLPQQTGCKIKNLLTHKKRLDFFVLFFWGGVCLFVSLIFSGFFSKTARKNRSMRFDLKSWRLQPKSWIRTWPRGVGSTQVNPTDAKSKRFWYIKKDGLFSFSFWQNDKEKRLDVFWSFVATKILDAHLTSGCGKYPSKPDLSSIKVRAISRTRCRPHTLSYHWVGQQKLANWPTSKSKSKVVASWLQGCLACICIWGYAVTAQRQRCFSTQEKGTRAPWFFSNEPGIRITCLYTNLPRWVYLSKSGAISRTKSSPRAMATH